MEVGPRPNEEALLPLNFKARARRPLDYLRSLEVSFNHLLFDIHLKELHPPYCFDFTSYCLSCASYLSFIYFISIEIEIQDEFRA